MDSSFNTFRIQEKDPALYSSFSERARRYHSTVATSVPRSGDSGDEHILSTYEKIAKKNPRRTKLAVLAAVLVGGGSTILGFRKQLSKVVSKATKNLKMSKIKDSKGYQSAQGATKQGLTILYNLDVFRNKTVLKGIEALGRPGKWLSKISMNPSTKLSAKFSKRKYQKLEKKLDVLNKYIKENKNAYAKGSIERETMDSLSTLLNGEKGLKKSLDEIIKGFDGRKEYIKKQVDEVSKVYDNKYLNGAKADGNVFTRLFNGIKTLGRDIVTKDTLRGGKNELWHNVESGIESKINHSGNAGKLIKDLDKLLKKLPKNINDTHINKHFKSTVNNTKSVVKGFKKAKKFEIENFAGRSLDLKNGGGMTEMLVPTVVGGILAGNILKGDTLQEKKENFFKNGGVTFAGSLSTWFVLQMLLSFNGPTAIALSLGSGVLLDKLSKLIYNPPPNDSNENKNILTENNSPDIKAWEKFEQLKTFKTVNQRVNP